MTDHDDATTKPSATSFEQSLSSEIAREFLKEQKRARRWGIFFRFLMALYVFGFFAIYLSGQTGFGKSGIGGDKHTALIEVSGEIGAGSDASADNIISGLRAAFKDHNTEGVILRINSPGAVPSSPAILMTKSSACAPSIPIFLYMRLSVISAHPGVTTSPARPRRSTRTRPVWLVL